MNTIKNLSAVFVTLFILLLTAMPLKAQELIIGEEIVDPGIHFIFEGAIKDDVTPEERNLPESQTDVHIEARVNWATSDEVDVPEGTPRGGFVPYIIMSAEVTNQETGDIIKVDLIPHLNLIDNFHYARNIALPGGIDDPYKVTFYVHPPTEFDLALHKDWRDNHGNKLFERQVFTYENIDFEEIAKATRR